jgi:hypothetical protein
MTDALASNHGTGYRRQSKESASEVECPDAELGNRAVGGNAVHIEVE